MPAKIPATTAKAVKIRRGKKEFTEDSLLEVLEEVRDVFLTSNEFYFRYALQKKGVSATILHYWTKKSAAIKEAVDELDILQQDKMLSAMLYKKSDINIVSAIFYLKTKGGFIEEAIRLKLESDKQVTMAAQKLIRIGFEDDCDSV